MGNGKRNKRYVESYRKLKKFLNHICAYFDVSYDIFDDTIYIHGEKSEFYVSIKGGLEKSKYQFYHRNRVGSGHHLQGEYKLGFGLFMIASHDFDLKYDIPRPVKEDYYRFCQDYSRLKKYQLSKPYRK